MPPARERAVAGTSPRFIGGAWQKIVQRTTAASTGFVMGVTSGE
jgi:hypothetical protein